MAGPVVTKDNMSYAEAVDARAAKNTTERPLGWPYLAFTARRGRLPKRGRRPIRNQAVSPTAQTGDSMTPESELAWALADAVSVCFRVRDRLGIYTALGAGESYTAIEMMLDITVSMRYPLPAKLISALAVWLGCYVGNEHEPTTRRRLLNRVEPQALRTTAPPLSRGVWVRSPNPSISIGQPERSGTQNIASEGPR